MAHIDATQPLQRIPVTDIAPFLDGDVQAKQRVAANVAQACEETGFLVISGHGLAQSTIDAAIAGGFAFFDQPAAIKDTYHPQASAGSAAITASKRAALPLRSTTMPRRICARACSSALSMTTARPTHTFRPPRLLTRPTFCRPNPPAMSRH